MDRWYVKKGYCEGIERRLVQIEQDLERLNTEGGEKLLEEWNRRYEEYRQLCISHGFWNWIIEDRTTFIPTQFQLKKERIKKEELESLFDKWKDRMLENQVLLDYLRTCPRKHAIKKDMLKDLSDGDSEKRKIINAIYCRLIKAKVIAEKENQEGKIETRIVNHRKNKDITIKPLPPSRFDPKVFGNVGKKDIYKVEYTVDEPNDLDYEKKTCYFVSKSSGDIYRTSLEKCTCPIYHKGNACKHMVTLALKLGYLDKETVLRK